MSPISACARLLAVLSLTATFGQAFAANTYYVSPSGLDTNPGTAASPWLTIQKAANTLAPGDTALIADGVYAGGIDHRTSGIPGAPITFRAINPGGPVLVGDQTGVFDAFHINHADYVVVDGLTVHFGNRGIRIDNSNNCVVRRCSVFNSTVSGIFTNYSDDSTIEYNECAQMGHQHGIYVSNSGDRPILRYNLCHDNPEAGIQLNGDGKHVLPALGTRGDGIIQDGQIVGNICYHNGLNGRAAALNLLSVRSTLVANNLIFNNLTGGIAMGNDNLQTATQWGSKDNRILNNTIYFRPLEGRWCVSVTNGSTNNLVQNNILFGGSRGAYEMDTTSGIVANFNLLPTAGHVGVATNQDLHTYYSLSQWQQVTSSDLNSSQADPHFISAAASPFDFHVAAGSAAISAGIWHPDVPADLDGNLRPAGAVCDAGCYQSAAAVTYSVSGRVMNGTAGVGGITVAAGTATATSAPDGSYTLLALPKGTYVISASNSGYVSLTRPSVTLGPSATGVDITVVSLLGSVSIVPASVQGGTSSTGAVTLVAAAPAGGSFISLSSSSASASVSASITVPAGAASATFSIATSAVASSSLASITATLGAAQASANLTILPPTLASITVSPTTVAGGSTATGTVTLTGPAPAGGSTVTISSGSTAVTVPATATVPAGATSASFSVQTGAVTANTQATITAAFGSVTATAALTVVPNSVKSVSLNPSAVSGGQSSIVTVTLASPSPAGGIVVALASNNAAAQVPATLTIPAGSVSATAAVRTTSVSAGVTATITASYGGGSASAALTVSANSLSSVTLISSATGNEDLADGVVTLSAAAPAGGTVVQLSANPVAGFTLPATVTVPTGSTSATFSVTRTGGGQTVTITATLGGATRQTTYTFN